MELRYSSRALAMLVGLLVMHSMGPGVGAQLKLPTIEELDS